MDFSIKPHRHADSMLERDEFKDDWNNLIECIKSITDDDIIADFEEFQDLID